MAYTASDRWVGVQSAFTLRRMVYTASDRWVGVQSAFTLRRFLFSANVSNMFVSNTQQLLLGCGFLGTHLSGYLWIKLSISNFPSKSSITSLTEVQSQVQVLTASVVDLGSEPVIELY